MIAVAATIAALACFCEQSLAPDMSDRLAGVPSTRSETFARQSASFGSALPGG